MQVKKTGLIPKSLLITEISNAYNVPENDINVHWFAREEEVLFILKTQDTDIFSTVTETTLEEEEIFEIVKSILHDKNISFHSTRNKITDDFKGVEFTYGDVKCDVVGDVEDFIPTASVVGFCMVIIDAIAVKVNKFNVTYKDTTPIVTINDKRVLMSIEDINKLKKDTRGN